MMALAWLDTRSMEAVTWQRDDWRRENGLPETTYGVSALSEYDPEDQHPLYFNTGRAFVEFRRLCEAGKLVAFGMSAAKGEPVPMRTMDWAFGRMEFSSKLDEVWRVGGDSFSRIMVEQSQLLAVAEPHAVPASGPILKPRRRGRPGVYPWADFMEQCEREWADRAGFQDGDPKFSRAAHLRKIMHDWCAAQPRARGWGADGPGDTLMKTKVREFLKTKGIVG